METHVHIHCRPLVVSIIMIGIQVSQIKKNNLKIMEEKSKSIVLMAEAAREEMASKLSTGLIKDLDKIENSKILGAVPVVTAMDMAAKNAEKLNFKFRAPKFSPRNPSNNPTHFEAQILNEIKAKDLFRNLS